MVGSIAGVSSGNSGIGVLTATSNAVDAGEFFVWDIIMNTAIPSSGFWFDYGPTLTLSELEFQEQKRLFETIPPLLLEEYRGQFVASRDGRIVDSDDDFVTLTHRFFQNAGDVPVYITKLGDDEGIFIETPFSD